VLCLRGCITPADPTNNVRSQLVKHAQTSNTLIELAKLLSSQAEGSLIEYSAEPKLISISHDHSDLDICRVR